jgi:trigger factor
LSTAEATDCKRTLDIEIPLEEVERARERVTNSIKERVRLPGFRPGKAPISMIQSRFEGEIRNEVLEMLLPQAFRERVQKEDLKVVGSPNITDLQFDTGQPIRFKADFEVAPEFELSEYHGLPAKYEEPTVTDEEVAERLNSMRESKAEYPNQDPRPLAEGDHALVHLKSAEGLAEPIDQDVQIALAGEETLPEFKQALVGMSPDETKEVSVTYPEDYGQEKLAGKTVRFELTPKFVRQKELPELDDEFARDLGDYQTLDELRDAVRKSIFQEKQYVAQQEAKEQLIDRLVEANSFAVPEVYIDRQVENQVRMQLRNLVGEGFDASNLKLDWEKLKETHREKALRNVRASLLLEKIAEREGIGALKDEVDREVQRLARQNREAVPVTRARLEKDGTIGRIAGSIQTEKTLQFLFDQAQKQA